MKKPSLLVLALAAGLSLDALAAPVPVPEPPTVEAHSYVLFDFHSGQVLAENNAHGRAEPASITKVMTSYVAFDEIRSGHVKAGDEVLISEKAWRQGIDSSESRMFIEVGKRVRFEDLLRGVIVQSGNDASVAVAEHIAGDESVFAQLMNKHAQRLGMKNSHFDNAPGLPSEQLYTTAYDVALLSQALIRDFPEGYAMFKEREFVYNNIRQQNRNMLLDTDPSADGIKTGYTAAAGYCLAASAIRENRRLIAVIMGSKSPRLRTQQAKALLDYGFRFFETTQLYGAASPVSTVRVWKGAEEQLPIGTMKPIALSLPRGSGAQLQTTPTISGTLVAPISAGQKVGTIEVTLGGKVLRTEPLVALKAIPEGGLWQRLSDTVRLWWSK